MLFAERQHMIGKNAFVSYALAFGAFGAFGAFAALLQSMNCATFGKH
jgi:hypothetical protein